MATDQARAESLEDRLREAQDRLSSGDLQGAWSIVQGLAAPDQTRPAVRNLRGNLLVRSGAVEKAIPEFAAAADADFANARYRVNLALALEAAGQYEDAAWAYDFALRGDPDAPLAAKRLGRLLTHLQRYEQAGTLAHSYLARHPDEPDMLAIAAEAALAQERQEDAKGLITRALARYPRHHHATVLCARMANEARRYRTALRLLEALPEDSSRQPDYQLQLGVAKGRLGDAQGAEELLRACLADPLVGGAAKLHVADFLHRARRYDEALPLAADAVRAMPDSERPWRLYIQCLRFAKDSARVDPELTGLLASIGAPVEVCRRVLALLDDKFATDNVETFRFVVDRHPTVLRFRVTLANILRQAGRFAESEAELRIAVRLDPFEYRAWNALALVAVERLDNETALGMLRTASRCQPNSVAVMNNMASVLRGLRRPRAALDMMRRVDRLKPGDPRLRLALGILLLCLGELEAGFTQYGSRFDSPEFPSPKRPFEQPMWDGESLAGKRVLVWMEQGLGDEISFAWLLRPILREAREVHVEVNDRLVPLFRRAFPAATIFARDHTPPTAYIDPANPLRIDCRGPIMNFGRRFWIDIREQISRINDRRSRGEAISEPYLHADDARRAAWRARLAGGRQGPRIGICWRSGNMKGLRRHNYLEVDALLALADLGTGRFVNLQYDATPEELAQIQAVGRDRVVHFEDIDLKDDQDELAALIASLDLVISANTAVAQLAGALGVPTWVFLHATEGMIWTQFGTSFLPFHPNSELFFRDEKEVWAPVLAEFQRRLLALGGAAGKAA